MSRLALELGSLSSIGRYEVVERLGSGGFATVYLVRDPVLDSEVAAKVLAENWTGSDELRERFIREAQLLRRIDSHRVVTVHDIGELPSGQPYFVMSLANRGTLEGRLTRLQAPPSREDVNALAHQLADCVLAVHAHDLIHRDIKPSNLLITSSLTTGPTPESEMMVAGERIVLGDFGLAKDIALQATGLTIAAGTGGYAAPEQMSPTGAPDRRTDLYAATAVLYRIVTNTLPPAFDLGRQEVPFPDTEWWMVGQLGQFFRQGMSYHQQNRYHAIETWLVEFVSAYGGGDLQSLSGPAAIDPGPGFDPQSAPTDVIRTSSPPVPHDSGPSVIPGRTASPSPPSPSGPSSLPAPSVPSAPPGPSAPSAFPPAAEWQSPPRMPSVPAVRAPLNVPSAPPSQPARSAPSPSYTYAPATEHYGQVRVGGHSGPPSAVRAPVGYIEPVRRTSALPLVLVMLIALAAIAGGGYFLAFRGEAPVIVGPNQVTAGELQVFRATFDGADTFRWTDWNDQTTTGDTFEFRGIVPGAISFEVEAITDGEVSRATSHRVEIKAAPDSPVIIGLDQVRVGVEETFRYEVGDGTDPVWIDESGTYPGDIYSLRGTAPGPFEVTLIVTRSDGVTRVGTRKVIQIVS